MRKLKSASIQRVCSRTPAKMCEGEPDSAASGPEVGLILTGGGARAAYQVGVLVGLMQILNPSRSRRFANPFHIICGSSAGAVNAAALACGAQHIHHAIHRLEGLWRNLHTGRIYRADAAGLTWTGARWLLMLGLGWLLPNRLGSAPQSLLDNSPLGELLAASLDFSRLRRNLDRGTVRALAITATAYTTGEHLTFYEARRAIQPWRRSLRLAIPCALGPEHLMASSAIPFVFPSQRLAADDAVIWCGDGSMRQLAPLSPAIHLGADKVMVVGTDYKDDTHPEKRSEDPAYPSLAQIGGQALSSIFLDSLSMDVERLERLNELLAQIPPNGLQSHSLRRVEKLVITPSRSLDELALRHWHEMPRAARSLFRVLGVAQSANAHGADGGALASYVLFEAGYTRALVELGRADCLSRTEEVLAFFEETP